MAIYPERRVLNDRGKSDQHLTPLLSTVEHHMWLFYYLSGRQKTAPVVLQVLANNPCIFKTSLLENTIQSIPYVLIDYLFSRQFYSTIPLQMI